MLDNPRIKSIPPSAPFLPTLVEALLSGELIPGFKPADDPLSLASVTIWLPTRRAVRAMASEFTSRLGQQAAILPDIRALGDAYDDDLLDLDGVDTGLDATINATERQLILAKLISAWSSQLNREQVELFAGSQIIVPSSHADAIGFAAELARLMDTATTEEVDWQKLETLVPLELGRWWMLTLDFLKIAIQAWPAILEERGVLDGAALRTIGLRRQSTHYRSHGSSGPVIAAGSTGSIPATADLLAVISQLPQGAVVLPGLDLELPDEVWHTIDRPDNEFDDSGPSAGHPQFGLKKLLQHLGYIRGSQEHVQLVPSSGESAGHARMRERLVSLALQPSESTHEWQELFHHKSGIDQKRAFEGVSLIEADEIGQEALAIALSLRETLETPFQTAALITPDRNLARRVAIELRRFGIDADDSAGQPLRNRPHGTFIRLVAALAFGEPDPVALVSLLKHPLCSLGETEQVVRQATRLLELALLRGAMAPPSFGQFAQCAQDIRECVNEGTQRVHRSLNRFSDEDWDQLGWLAESLDRIFGSGQTDPRQTSVKSLAEQTVLLMEACAEEPGGALNALYGTHEGMALRQFLESLLQSHEPFDMPAGEWPQVLDTLLSSQVVRPPGGQHSRLAILGPLEARLQTFDRVVLGGLNEGSWPDNSRNDPFLSRPMKSALGLPLPERRIGLAAHDFQMLMGQKDVVLTRAMKLDGAPSVASRWVQRLLLVAGADAAKQIHTRGQVFLDWAQQIDQSTDAVPPAVRPEPSPPVALRPNRLSITEIETWINDPYAIYAKHVLKLTPVEPLVWQADMRERGTLYHAIMEDFVAHLPVGNSRVLQEHLMNAARLNFKEWQIPADKKAVWLPRFELLARDIAQWQADRSDNTEAIFVELKGETSQDLNGFTLSGRVDRIDFTSDGQFDVFDYKTGSNPSAKRVKDLVAPQLPLSAAMVKRGAFGIDETRPLNSIGYIRLVHSDALKIDQIGEASSELADKAWIYLQDLIAAYQTPDQGYRSKARPNPDQTYAGDYDHLARIAQWSRDSAESEDGDV